MRAWRNQQRAFTTGDVALVAATEAVVATLNGVSADRADVRIDLDGWVDLLGTAGTTTTTLRIRRDSLTGTLVGEANAQATAGANGFSVPISVQDTPGEISQGTYVLTATVAGGNATARQASLSAAS